MDGLGNIPTLYARLINELERAASQLPFNPYQSLPMLLLKYFNPLFQWRFWHSGHARRYISNPDAFQQELPFAAQFFQKIEHLTLGQMEALHQCNTINVQRLSKRILVGNMNKFIGGVSGLFGVVIAFREAFNINLFTSLSVGLLEKLMGYGLGAFVLNSVFGYLLLSHKIKLLRAFDDLLLVTKAFATSRKESAEKNVT